MLEALAAGLPVFISENLLTELPFLTPDVSIALKNGSPCALPPPAALAALGVNARRLAEEKFSFGTMAANYEALYREAAARKP